MQSVCYFLDEPIVSLHVAIRLVLTFLLACLPADLDTMTSRAGGLAYAIKVVALLYVSLFCLQILHLVLGKWKQHVQTMFILLRHCHVDGPYLGIGWQTAHAAKQRPP